MDFDDKAVKTCLGELIRVSKEKVPGNGGTGSNSNARYGGILSDDTLRTFGYPCHVYMAEMHSPKAVYIRFTNRKCLSGQARRRYFDWIVGDDSPWKSFEKRGISHGLVDDKIIDASLDWIYEHGWCWSDLSSPSNLQHSFLVASRMPAEWPRSITLWNKWCKKLPVEKPGMRALIFLFLEIFKKYRNSKRYQISHADKYDWPVDVCHNDEDYARNFCLGNVVGKLNDSYFKDSNYRPVNKLWGQTDNPTYGINPKSYPSTVFNLYHADFGPGEEKCKKEWLGKTGFTSFKYLMHWWVSEEEVLKIINLEYSRLIEGNVSACRSQKKTIVG